VANCEPLIQGGDTLCFQVRRNCIVKKVKDERAAKLVQTQKSLSEVSIDISFHSLVLRLFTQTVQKETYVRKAIVLTSDQELVVIEVKDPQYILASTFPKENSLALFEDLHFTDKVVKKDLTYFEVQLNQRSNYKGLNAGSSEQASTLKLFQKDKDFMEQIGKKIKVIVDNGRKRSRQSEPIEE